LKWIINQLWSMLLRWISAPDSLPVVISLDRGGLRQRLPQLAQAIALQALLELPFGLFRGGHPAVADHALGKTNGSLGVYILCVYMLDVVEAVAGRVLDAPSPPRGAPFDLGPKLSVDGESVGRGSTSEADFNDPMSSRIAHVVLHLLIFPYPPNRPYGRTKPHGYRISASK
jgi:hypothetical protein